MAEQGTAPGPVDPTVYRLRAHAFVNRRTYRLTGNALTWEEDGKPLDGVFYDGIAEIRLAYAPTRVASNRYRAQIILREGGMVELFNTDYRGILDFPEQNDAYVAFLRELHKRVAAAGGPIRYRQGNTMAGYVGNVVLTVLIFAGLVALFFLLTAMGLTWLVVVKLALLLYFIPILIRYIRRSKPADYDPRAIPQEVLPAVATIAQSP